MNQEQKYQDQLKKARSDREEKGKEQNRQEPKERVPGTGKVESRMVLEETKSLS